MHGSQAIVPVVGLVPLGEHWTAVVSERYTQLSDATRLSPDSFAALAKDVTAVSRAILRNVLKTTNR